MVAWNGEFAIPFASTSIGDTVAVTLPEGPAIQGGMIVDDSIRVFASRRDYRVATQNLRFRETDAPVVRITLSPR